MKYSLKTVSAITASLILALSSGVSALELESLTVGGHYLGGLNFLRQANRSEATGQRVQFDYAANLDFEIGRAHV